MKHEMLQHSKRLFKLEYRNLLLHWERKHFTRFTITNEAEWFFEKLSFENEKRFLISYREIYFLCKTK